MILTASMGEGHNTAARNIQQALQAEAGSSVEVLVVDPYTRTNPVVNRCIQKGYAAAINNYPRLWKMVFAMLSQPKVIEGMAPLLLQLTNAVHSLVREFQPDLIASTYPVFGYIMQRIRRVDPAVAMPFYMVITDSTMINQTWYRYPCDGAIVADEPTAEVLRNDGVAEDKIHVLGFPVGLQFDEFIPAPPPHDGNWRLLFFPGGPLHRAFETLNHLSTIQKASVTVITGRRQDAHAALSRAGLPKRGHLIGWTDKMPDLMGSHHIFIGKAGGATVQEAIAAQIPFVVNHIVPGQEEGNIALIQQTAIGALASNSPADILHIVKGAMANEAALWRTWRKNLVQIQKPSASRAIASFLLKRAVAR
ncbi:MAG: glycosyltransferase [Verrucomicrobia bacterium]|nr:glycosyltransferase [Verrucomicrobiota bacterium]